MGDEPKYPDNPEQCPFDADNLQYWEDSAAS